MVFAKYLSLLISWKDVINVIKKKKDELIEEFCDYDKKALVDMYYKRCLTPELLKRFIYTDITEDEDFSEYKTERLRENGLITPVEYKGGNIAYFLTSDGVVMARYYIGHDSRYRNSNIEKKSSELMMSHIIIAHQTALNRFSYELADWAREEDISFAYRDQIFAPNLSRSMMTDGLFFLEDEILLIETDTGTETTKDLRVKWTNYSTFLNNPAEAYKDKKLKVFFVLENVKNGQCRRVSVFSAIHALLCVKLSEQFEIYAGTPEELLAVLRGEPAKEVEETISTLKKRQGFEVREVGFDFLEDELGFDRYIYMDGDSNGILKVDGRIQEYVVDFWFDCRASILSKIQYFSAIEHKMRQSLSRSMGYVVVLPNERFISQLVKKARLDIAENVFFTTENRLKRNTWNKALFRTDLNQCMYYYEDASLITPVYQKKMVK